MPGTVPTIGDDALLGNCQGSALVSRTLHGYDGEFRAPLRRSALVLRALHIGLINAALPIDRAAAH